MLDANPNRDCRAIPINRNHVYFHARTTCNLKPKCQVEKDKFEIRDVALIRQFPIKHQEQKLTDEPPNTLPRGQLHLLAFIPAINNV